MIGIMILVFSISILLDNAASQVGKIDDSDVGTTQASLMASPPALSSSILDLFFPRNNVQPGGGGSFSGQSYLNIPGLSPTSTPDSPKRSAVLNGVDFSQLTQLCQTMAALNRAKKMNDAARTAASKPNDPTGWMELIRQTEPIMLDNFACKMIERIIIDPQDFVTDLLRMFMPAGTANLLQQKLPEFGLPKIAITSAPVSEGPSSISPLTTQISGRKDGKEGESGGLKSHRSRP